MPSHILIAYDGSASAGTAIRVAAALLPGARAVVATVAENVAIRPETVTLTVPTISPEIVQRTVDEMMDEARGDAARIAHEGAERAQAAGLDAEPTQADPGAAIWSSLLELAHRSDVDAIVCATRGRGGFARALLGSTASSLLHHSDLPLLIVPDAAADLAGPAVVAYDGSESSERAIESAGRLLSGRRVVVVHVWHSQFRRGLTVKALAHGPTGEVLEALDQTLEDAAKQTTGEGVDRARAAGLDATGVTLESDAGVWRTVVSTARSENAATIVCGARGLGGARSALLGSVSSALVHNADLPVLVVPGSNVT
jgi:nucleotide-binding universal stress UspA family protein